MTETTFRGRPNRPGPAHDALVRLIVDTIEGTLDERLPTMATVTGRDGGDGKSGNVRVRLDDEDVDRAVGFPRKKGQRFDRGDRVLVMKTRAGDPVVIGSVTGGGGAASEQGVDNDQLYDDAIDGKKIRKNAVGSDQLAGGAVDTNHLAQGLKNTIEKAIQPSDVKGSVGEKNKIVTESALPDLSGYAKTSQIRNEALGNKALALDSDVQELVRKIRTLETEVKRLKEKKDKDSAPREGR